MLTRIAILVRESSPTAAQYLQESKTAARNLGIDLQIENERTPDDLDGIFAALKGASALVVAQGDMPSGTTAWARLALVAVPPRAILARRATIT